MLINKITTWEPKEGSRQLSKKVSYEINLKKIKNLVNKAKIIFNKMKNKVK